MEEEKEKGKDRGDRRIVMMEKNRERRRGLVKKKVKGWMRVRGRVWGRVGINVVVIVVVVFVVREMRVGGMGVVVVVVRGRGREL